MKMPLQASNLQLANICSMQQRQQHQQQQLRKCIKLVHLAKAAHVAHKFIEFKRSCCKFMAIANTATANVAT